MRREERHHLKENPLAVMLTETQGWLADHGRSVMVGVGVVLLAMVIAGAYFWWTQVQIQRAGGALAEAMSVLEAPVVPPPSPDDGDPAGGSTDVTLPPAETEDADDDDAPADDPPPPPPPPVEPEPFEQPDGTYPSLDAKLEVALPMLLEVAEAYPRTQQGVTARYQAATVLVALGRVDDAVPHFHAVIDGSGDELYRQMGLMGLAEAHLLAGEPQEAITLLEGQTAAVESLIPVDAVLMRLGRAYEQAGQMDDALAAFNRVVEEFPISVYYADAQQAVDTLRQQGSGGGASASE